MKKWLSSLLVFSLLTVTPVAGAYAEQQGSIDQAGKGGGEQNGKPDKPGKPEEKPGKPGEKPGKDGGSGGDEPSTGDETTTDGGATTPDGTTGDGTQQETTTPPTDTTAPTPPLPKNAAVKQAVELKKQLIELRQQLKKSTELTDELKAKYEELTTQLEQVSELKQALEVQKELLNRFYQPGDQEMFEKLGELYEKTGEETLNTFVNGDEVTMDSKPFIQKGRAMVPVRAISNALKAEVNWSADTRTVEVVRGETKITLYLDKNEADVNGTIVKLESAPVIKNGRVFLPLRFIGEQLKANVNYQKQGDIIIIDDNTSSGTDTSGTAAPTSGTTDGGTSDTPPTTGPVSETPSTELQHHKTTCKYPATLCQIRDKGFFVLYLQKFIL